MKNAIEFLQLQISDDNFISLNISSPRSKSSELRNIIANAVNTSNEFKVEFRLQKHNDIKSIPIATFKTLIEKNLLDFKQCLIKKKTEEIQLLINKKGTAKIITKKLESKEKQGHNRKKNYLIPDGERCDFLIEIGVMDNNGRVRSQHYKKFKQINRFLEMVDDMFQKETQEQLHIVDFGCGKSYLTFALYHYFSVIKKQNVQITGIDLKQEVIDHCNNIAQKINYNTLKFAHGFIHDVTLHACDTATDDAILFSLRNNASKMMFVPCCQHELNKQIKNADSSILLKHGIFKDRMTSLVTDTMRSQLLEACGYKVQSMEFIDLEHTAKNILLRCQKVDRKKDINHKAYESYLDFKRQWNISPYLEAQLREDNKIPEL
jgi:SAM-dependent methyltransferase